MQASRRASSSGYRYAIAFAAPSFGRKPRGIGLAAMIRAGNTARESTRPMSWATWRLVFAARALGSERMTRSASSSVNAPTGTAPTIG
ncbi:hypothetical protein BE17_00625 [Sorangium cellulosum]|uniref:Uncharacterized protein n=1 Tax=Sorangium cellulosum TaxID=56 RepID=A0A150SF28_SORCE|nr:hypothetical protein BE17_00625 [Sorangium cellulosum]